GQGTPRRHVRPPVAWPSWRSTCCAASRTGVGEGAGVGGPAAPCGPWGPGGPVAPVVVPPPPLGALWPPGLGGRPRPVPPPPREVDGVGGPAPNGGTSTTSPLAPVPRRSRTHSWG